GGRGAAPRPVPREYLGRPARHRGAGGRRCALRGACRRHGRRSAARPACAGDLEPGAGRAAARRLGGLRRRAEAPRGDPARADPDEVAVPNVLVTTAFGEAQLARLRQVSPRLTVARAEPETADYASAEILYAGVL